MTRLLPHRVALYAFILALVGGLTACHQSIAPTEEELAGSCEQAVRITARVSPYGGAPAGTRANVDGKVVNEHTDDWQPRSKPGTGGEVRISRLFLIVTKRGSDKIERLIYYTDPEYKPGKVNNGKLSGTNIKAKYLTILDEQLGVVTMDLSLLPGDYTFYPIANSKALEGKVTGFTANEVKTLADLRGVTSPNTSFVAEESQTSSYENDFPIIGMGELSVPSSIDLSKPVELTPEIPMERLFARVDLTLTTAKDMELTDYLSEADGETYRPSDYKLHKLNVLAYNISIGNKYWYPLLPVPGEYTSLPAGLPRASDFKAPSISPGTPANPIMEDGSNPSESYSWQKFVNDGATGRLRILWQQPLLYTKVYKDTEDKAFHLYLPAIYLPGVTDKDKSIRLELKFKKLDGSGEILTYRIPIHNEKDAADYYSIRRNTIYHIDLTFYGSKLEVKQSNAEYTVDTWEDKPVDIPW
ncbi:hypothetical protein [Porphyromonas bennonis]|uniref:hypothetical protein n=1 Tax=Porphyromonas bennonis TaxID=501496 RepID=UPI00039A61E6|nr:hypothetical protein [Porphyromonas bennonis]